jgi:hypothetical protein
LSGPLNPGIALVASLLIFLHAIPGSMKNPAQGGILHKGKQLIKNIPGDYYFYLIPISAFSMYSLYLGSFNSVYKNIEMPLSVLYSKLPYGLYHHLIPKHGLFILLIMSAINALIRNKLKTTEGDKILRTYKWIGLFALLYIILLPLGGYRSYRPYILRYDTILPLTLSLIFIYVKMTVYIFKDLSFRWKRWYIPITVLIMLIFVIKDEPGFKRNDCERRTIARIAESKETVVKISGDCNILSWTQIRNPADSELKIRLLEKWGIVKEKKLYYQ